MILLYQFKSLLILHQLTTIQRTIGKKSTLILIQSISQLIPILKYLLIVNRLTGTFLPLHLISFACLIEGFSNGELPSTTRSILINFDACTCMCLFCLFRFLIMKKLITMNRLKVYCHWLQ